MEQFLVFVHNNLILSIAWVIVLTLIIITFLLDTAAGIKKITPNGLAILVNGFSGIVVDLRSDKEFRNGHIVNSLNLLPEEIKNKNISKLAHFKNNPVILVDANGFNTFTTAKLLKKQGFAKVSILKGGMEEWLKDNLPLSKLK